jgi:hypothetical protein
LHEQIARCDPRNPLPAGTNFAPALKLWVSILTTRSRKLFHHRQAGFILPPWLMAI